MISAGETHLPGRPRDIVGLKALAITAQHSDGADLLDSLRKSDIPGVGMVMVDGVVRCGRSRNTPPAERIPERVEP